MNITFWFLPIIHVHTVDTVSGDSGITELIIRRQNGDIWILIENSVEYRRHTRRHSTEQRPSSGVCFNYLIEQHPCLRISIILSFHHNTQTDYITAIGQIRNITHG